MAWKFVAFTDLQQQSYIKMLRNLLDLENNLAVRNVHKSDKNVKRVKQQEGRCMEKSKQC